MASVRNNYANTPASSVTLNLRSDRPLADGGDVMFALSQLATTFLEKLSMGRKSAYEMQAIAVTVELLITRPSMFDWIGVRSGRHEVVTAT